MSQIRAGISRFGLSPGQAFFMKRGTMHGFRNTGQTPAGMKFSIWWLMSTYIQIASVRSSAQVLMQASVVLSTSL